MDSMFLGGSLAIRKMQNYGILVLIHTAGEIARQRPVHGPGTPWCELGTGFIYSAGVTRTASGCAISGDSELARKSGCESAR